MRTGDGNDETRRFGSARDFSESLECRRIGRSSQDGHSISYAVSIAGHIIMGEDAAKMITPEILISTPSVTLLCTEMKALFLIVSRCLLDLDCASE